MVDIDSLPIKRSIECWILRHTPENNISVLLLKVAARPDVHPAFWQPVTGGIEEGESVLQGVRREIFEETGLHILWRSLVVVRQSYDIPIDNDFIARKILFYIWTDIEKITFNPDEHEAFSWIDQSAVNDYLYWQSNKQAWQWVQEKLQARSEL